MMGQRGRKNETVFVPVERVRPILKRAIAERANDDVAGNEGTHKSGFGRVAMDIALNTGKNKGTIEKMMGRILVGWQPWQPKSVVNAHDRPPTKGMLEKLDKAGVKYTPDMNAFQAIQLLKENIKREPYTHVSFYLVDEILTGLHWNHLWYTELYDIYSTLENGKENGCAQ